MTSINKGVILAGGYGKRFLPWTAGVSKTMLPIIDKPTVAYIVDDMLMSNITQICIIVGYRSDNIINYFKRNLPQIDVDYKNYCIQNNKKYDKIHISFIRQRKQKGTANALLCAKKFIKKDDFVVACGDEIFVGEVPIFEQLLKIYRKNNNAVIASKFIKRSDATRFGVLEVDGIGYRVNRLKAIIEKPPIEKIKKPLVNLGRYVLPNIILKYLNRVKPNSSGEYALTDAIVNMAKESDVFCYNFKGKYYDIGNKIGYTQCVIDFALNSLITKEKISKFILRKIEIKNNKKIILN